MSKPFNLRQYLINVLRRASYRFPERNKVLVAARIGRNQYVCTECPGKVYTRKEVSIDHITPVRPVDRLTNDWTWDEFITNLFCDSSKLQVLCKPHHKEKTRMENILRRNYKKDLAENQKSCHNDKKDRKRK